MAENNNTVITNYRREALCKITSGALSKLPAISHVAFGDQGVNEDGSVKPPSGAQTALNHEVGRYEVGTAEYPIATTARYTVTIPAEDLPGTLLSEAALVDDEGNLCAIRNMLPKGKDEDVEFTFTFDDEF